MNISEIGRQSLLKNVRRTDVVIIGAGASGLAISHELCVRGVDHSILERGEIANSWRRERWDSLKLLTPNWLAGLPGKHYDGDDPNGFMTMSELIRFMDDYATSMAAPVFTGVTVSSVYIDEYGYRVETDQGYWMCRSVVVATGAFNTPMLPKVSTAIPPTMQTLTTHQYKNPQQLDDGGVLVVGASATGLQIASEIQTSGRQVTLAIGEHVRMPRTYRGKDIFWWLKHTGIANETFQQVDDGHRVRSLPSPQLIGSRQHDIFDLNKLSEQGVQLAGRLMNVSDHGFQFSGSLHNVCQLADLKMHRLLNRFDQWLSGCGVEQEFPPADKFTSTQISNDSLLQLPNRAIRTVIWATGFKPDYSWLRLPVLDHKGRLIHRGGVVNAPGLYVLGLPFLRRRNSSFINGIAEDACELAAHLHHYLNTSLGHRLHASV